MTTVYVKVGDQLAVKGSPIVCAVQNSNGTLNIVCAEGKLSSPTQGSYGVGIADSGVRLGAVTPSKLVKAVAEPAVSGAKFAVRSGKPHVYTLSPPSAVLFGGTHIFCALNSAGGINITCGLSSLAAHLQYPVHTYIMELSTRSAIVGEVEPKGAFKTVAAKAQP